MPRIYTKWARSACTELKSVQMVDVGGPWLTSRAPDRETVSCYGGHGNNANAIKLR